MYNSNEQKMMPRQGKNFGIPRIMTSMKNNRFDNAFRRPYAASTFPHSTMMSSPHLSFRYRSPYQYRKRPHCHPPSQTYSRNSFINAQYPPNSPSRTPSSHIYKNPQSMTQGRGGSSAIPPGSRRHNHENSRTTCLAGQFDVSDYVIPAMTSNPWSKLEELYANRRLDEQ